MVTPPSLFCLNCGAANPPQAKFCSACGNPLSAWREENIPTRIEQRPYDTFPANPPTMPAAPPPPQPPASGPFNKPPGNKRAPLNRIILAVVVILLIGSSVLALTLINNANATNQKNALATQQAEATGGARLATAAEATHEVSTSIAVAQATNNAAAATSVAQAQATNSAATATAAANPDPYHPANSALAFIDPLSQPDVWPTSSNTCQFVNGAYQVSELNTNALFDCVSYESTYTNFVFEVRMTVLKGDCGGMTLRGGSNSSTAYYFRICPIGTYAFIRYSSNGNPTIVTTGGVSGSFNPGLNQPNVIAVVANNSTFTLFINHQQVAVVNDTSYTQGILGLVADAYSNPTAVAFQDARVWTI